MALTQSTICITIVLWNNMVIQMVSQISMRYSPALADPTRRAILSRLAQGDASVN